MIITGKCVCVFFWIERGLFKDLSTHITNNNLEMRGKMLNPTFLIRVFQNILEKVLEEL